MLLELSVKKLVGIPVIQREMKQEKCYTISNVDQREENKSSYNYLIFLPI